MEDEAAAYCNKGLGLGLSLGLGLGLGGEYRPFQRKEDQHKLKPASLSLGLYFTLSPKKVEDDHKKDISIKTIDHADDESTGKTINEFHNKNSPRKKLRLTKDQASILEDSFQLHTTLNTVQKQALAERLSLKPRQVEVWFQNRRARTKLKQNEINCEFLKKSCARLSSENTRLKKELLELRGLKARISPLCSQLPEGATLTMCQSCERHANKANERKIAAPLSMVFKND